MLVALLTNVPAELNAISALWHTALHARAKIQAKLKEIQAALAGADLTDPGSIAAIPQILEEIKDLATQHATADATVQQHTAAITKGLADHALTVPPTPAVAAPATPAAPAAAAVATAA